MATRMYSFTMPADTAYHRLYDLIVGITGFSPANVLVPDRVYELIIGSDSGALKISDANNANVAGMPIATGGNLTKRSVTNDICLKEFYLMGNGLAVSGTFSWR